jgi:hypothetical protein
VSGSAADEKIEKEKVRHAAPDVANQSGDAGERFGEKLFPSAREPGFAEAR